MTVHDDEMELVRGRGNVFRDLDLPHAELEQFRSILAAKIIGVLNAERLSVRKAHEITRVAAADFSRIRQVKLDRFTLDRLMTKQAVFSSIVDVFQDLGYTMTGAEVNTGFITAESATKNKTSFWEALGYATGSGNTRATAFVETMPSKMTRVRLNFVSTKTSSYRYGQNMRSDKPIVDAKVYQAAFEKIDEALFVRKAVNAPAPSATGPQSAEPSVTHPLGASH